MKDDAGFVSAYRVAVTDKLDDTLAEIAALAAPEVWTALEFTGDPARPRISRAAPCARRRSPRRKPPWPG